MSHPTSPHTQNMSMLLKHVMRLAVARDSCTHHSEQIQQVRTMRQPLYNYMISVLLTAPGSSPRNCQVMAISSTSISVSWDVPFTTNGLIQYYTVTYQPMQSLAGQDLSSVSSTSIYTPDNSTELVLTQLLKATSYSINITASTVAGTGPSSIDQCTTYTLEDGRCI